MKKKYCLKYKTLIAIFVAVVLVSFGCVDLEEEPLDFPGPENFYKTPDQIISALTGAMSELYMKWNDYSYGYYEFHTDQNDDADLIFGSSHANWIWRAHYRSNNSLNNIIRALNANSLGDGTSQVVKDQLMGQARFIRGFNYFCLVRLYGDIPLITEETDALSGELTRQPIKDVYDFITADLQYSVDNLPEEWPEYPGRPSADAARALLSKVYLTMATAPLKETSYFQNARDMAHEVIENGVHSLIPDVRDVFKLENKLGPENIWCFNATSDDNATPPQIWLPGTMANGWADFGLARPYALAYPDQPRKDAYMILEDWEGNSWEEWSWRGAPLIRKYVYDDRETLESLSSTANIPILRYADVLLIFAEAENMINGGPSQAAVDAVNLVIDRANDGMPNPDHPRVTTSMTQAEFDAAVIRERDLELFFEYDRWYDLIRKEMLCDVWTDRPDIEANCDENDYLFPIPQADLRLNSNMTQNPGYSVPEAN